MDTKVLKLVGIGFVTGIINGLFGSGGGTLIVPALVFILGIEDYKAHATAISIILPLSIISTFIYLKKRYNSIPNSYNDSYRWGGVRKSYRCQVFK